jgi:cytochrome c-type biogenesis protein CcmH/NrfG
MAPDKDSQLERMNGQLRDRGCPPENDLWPGIEEAITAEENRLLNKPKKQRAGFWSPQVLLAAAAVVTFAIILVPLNFEPNVDKQMVGVEQQETNNALAFGQSESTLAEAMLNLEKAVLENPDDPNLLRLVRMVNSRQGELLRCKWAENTRVQDLLDGGVS